MLQPLSKVQYARRHQQSGAGQHQPCPSSKNRSFHLNRSTCRLINALDPEIKRKVCSQAILASPPASSAVKSLFDPGPAGRLIPDSLSGMACIFIHAAAMGVSHEMLLLTAPSKFLDFSEILEAEETSGRKKKSARPAELGSCFPF